MRLIIAVTSFLILSFSAMFIIGIMADSETIIEKDIIIDVPESVVFNTLIDFDNYSDWRPDLIKYEYDAGYSRRRMQYKFWPNDLILEEKIEINIRERIIKIQQAASNPASHLKDFTNNIRLVSLPDGSTNIFWRVSYQIEPVYGKFLNLIIIQPQFEKIVEDNLSGLQKYLE